MHRIGGQHLIPGKKYKQINVEIDRKEVSMAKRKNRINNQQIIYILPGPEPMLKNVNIKTNTLNRTFSYLL